ncbi:MAG TPA: hypothetical protein VLJ39_19460 [Tepidisphaeraceae bacterium]|nr:hypothetical protein [Tepidisphaeraceae bacterium]
MGSQSFILFAGDSDWRIGRLASGEASFVNVPVAGRTPAEHARQIALSLEELGYEGRGTLLALPSAWCYSASIATDDVPKNDRKAMLYRLEEKLPLPAEGLIADFIPGGPAAERALGIAVATRQAVEWVEALESAGVTVQSVAPAAMLASQGLPSTAGQDPYLLLCAEEGGDGRAVNLIEMQGGKPASWAMLPLDINDLKLQIELAVIDFDGPPRIESCGLSAPEVAAITEATGLVVTPRDGSPSEAAARLGAEVLAGRQRPWAELRRGPLAIADSIRQHRKPLNALLTAAAILLLALAGVMIFRGIRFEGLGSASDRRMVETFARQFPGWPTPVNVRAVVESEHRKAAARMGGSLPPEARRSALQTLRDVLAKLPAEGHFTIDRATFEDEGFQMEGKLRSYEDVDVVADAARRAGLTVDPPQARKDAEGAWIFALHGTRVTPSQTALAKPEDR